MVSSVTRLIPGIDTTTDGKKEAERGMSTVVMMIMMKYAKAASRSRGREHQKHYATGRGQAPTVSEFPFHLHVSVPVDRHTPMIPICLLPPSSSYTPTDR